MTDKYWKPITREEAMRVECFKCNASPGDQCVALRSVRAGEHGRTEEGEALTQFHRERLHEARRQLRERPEDMRGLFDDLEVHLNKTDEYEIIDGETYYYGAPIRAILDKHRK